MEPYESMQFEVETSLETLEQRRAEIDGELADLDLEDDELAALLWSLQRRRDGLASRRRRLLDDRDRVEHQLWSALRAQASVDATRRPTPPKVRLRSMTARAAIDPAPEPWDLGTDGAAAPLWVRPKQTWPLKTAVGTGATVRTGSGASSSLPGVPMWLPTSRTEPIYISDRRSDRVRGRASRRRA